MNLIHILDFSFSLLVELAIFSTLLLGIACGITLLMRRNCAAVKHQVWVTAMIGILLFPCFSPMLPRLISHHGTATTPPIVATEIPPVENLITQAPVEIPTVFAAPIEPQSPRPLVHVNTDPPLATPHPVVNHPQIVSTKPVSVSRDVPAPTPEEQASTDEARFPIFNNLFKTGTVTVWLCGAIAMFGSLLMSIFAAKRLIPRKQNCEVSDAIQHKMEKLAREMNLTKHVRLLISDKVCVPMIAGIFRPVVLLPRDSGDWSDEQTTSILRHELSHLHRNDPLWLLLSRLVCVVCWFQPLAWFAARQIRIERELACDDVVVVHEKKPRFYATLLLQLAREQSRFGGPLVVPMAKKHQVETRIDAILDSKKDRTQSTRRTAAFLLAAMFMLLIVAAMFSPFSPILIAKTTPQTAPNDETAQAVVELEQKPQTEHSITLKFFGHDDQPIPGATAEIHVDPPQTAEGWKNRIYNVSADQNGTAIVPYSEKEKMQHFSIRVTTAGFAPFRAEWRDPQRDPVPTEYTFRLDHALTVGGVVLDDSGKPLPDVNVSFSFPAGNRQRIMNNTFFYISAEMKTDENGRWKYESLPEDCLARAEMFTFKHPDFQMLDKQMPIARFKPNDEGEFTEIITMQKGVTVSGSVIDANGKPIVGAVAYGSNSTRSYQPEKTSTDENGRFEFENWTEAQGQYIVVRAEGFAPEMKDGIWARPNMQPIEFTLKPGKTIRAKVVDPEGNPIPNVWFALERWRSQRLLTDAVMGGRKATDAEGKFIWENAPEDEVVFDLLPDHNEGKFRYLRNQSVIASDSEYVFTLQPIMKVTGKVFDAKTNEIIPEFQILTGSRFENDQRYFWHSHATKIGHDGQFDVSYDDERNSIYIKIEAEGYVPNISREIDLSETNVTLNFAMEESIDENKTGITGIVHGPDGKPIQHATVALAVKNRMPYIQNGSFHDNTGCLSAKTDEQGHFTLPPIPPEEVEESTDFDFKLFVIHLSGFAEISKDDFQKANQTITLEKWATVEGTLQIGSEPGKEKELNLQPQEESRDWNKPRATFDYRATSNSQGKFVFEYVPAGQVKIFRTINYGIHSGGRMSCYSHGQSVKTNPGETATVKLGGTGWPVIGKLAVPDDFEGTPSWNFCHVTVTPDIGPRPELPEELEGLQKTIPDEIRTESDFEKQQTLIEAWKKTDAGRKFDEIASPFEKASKAWEARLLESWNKQIACAVDENGNFRLDDVPAGNWEINVDLTVPPPGNQCGFGEQVGYLRKVITIPDIPGGKNQTDEPFDVGTLTLEKTTPRPQLIAVGTEAPDFELKRLVPQKDGSDEPEEEVIKLSDFRGKTVIIDFWATWCGPCLEKIPELVQFYDKIKDNPDFVLMGISIDNDEQTLLDFLAKKENMGWIQLRTDPNSLLTDQYGIFAVPTLVVVDSNGNVSAINPKLASLVPKEE